MESLMMDDQFGVQLLRDDISETSTQTGSDDDSQVSEDESYYFADVVFLVEDRLFKVPRRYFEEDSEVFRDMFQLPVPKDVVPDGCSRENPLRLEGIAKEDFKQLLKIMYPKRFGQEEILSILEWTSVLKLATMWEFDEIRKLAIRKMSALDIDTVEKVVIARDYQVGEWLVPTINTLAQREQPLGVQDVNRLGWDYVLKVAEVRESLSSPNSGGSTYCRYCHTYGIGHGGVDRMGHDFTEVIRRVFEKDLEVTAL